MPFTPKLVESQENNVELSIVSNATLRSSETRKVGRLWSAELKNNTIERLKESSFSRVMRTVGRLKVVEI